MITLTGWDDILSGMISIYWLVAFSALGYVVYSTRKKTGWARWWRIGAVLLVFFSLPLTSYTLNKIERYQRKAQREVAMSRFEELCKGAGERVYKTIENVDGIFLKDFEFSNISEEGQYTKRDFYGFWCARISCISSLLYDKRMEPSGSGLGTYAPRSERLYQFVEVLDKKSNRIYRYTKKGVDGQLEVLNVDSVLSSYSVEWKDISKTEDRDLWIAGGALRINEIKTGELVAERIGYVIDPLQGQKLFTRSTWGWARLHGLHCPDVSKHNVEFIKKVLKPSSGVNIYGH